MSKIGEVIQTATAGYTAESHTLHAAPPFGSLVKAAQGPEEAVTIYGVVTGIATEALDPTRRSVARGREASSMAEIYQQHPQLQELFRTHFDVKVLGFSQDGGISHYFPPLPPEVHQLVYVCEPNEVADFTEALGFLPLLLAGQSQGATDEVTAAFLRYGAAVRGPQGMDFQVRAGKRLVALLRGESVRLNALLERLA